MTFLFDFWIYWASLVAQVVKSLPSNARDAGDPDLILGWGNPLEEEMTTHSSILAWKILWTEEPGGLQSMALYSWTRLCNWTHMNFFFQVFCLNFQMWGFYIYLLLLTTDLVCSRNILWVILRLETYFKAQYYGLFDNYFMWAWKEHAFCRGRLSSVRVC